MGEFASRLRVYSSGSVGRRSWIYIPYDQLSDRIGPLSRLAPERAGILLVEDPAKAARRPYHVQKLALVLANLRHFALEQGARGVLVRHVVASGEEGGTAAALLSAAEELGPLQGMEPAERELRAEIAPAVERGALRLLPHEGWLTTREQFLAGAGAEPPWRLDRFYRHVRRESGILMEGGGPAGGEFSFDAQNRRPWKGDPPAAEPPRFRPDAIVREVGELVRTRFAGHPGVLDLGAIPATARDAARVRRFAREECLPHFGPYQDAMSVRSTNLFHSRLSALLHLHRVLPRDAVGDALASDAPLASREAFVRQILGWREFVRHVHRETDGFRDLPAHALGATGTPGAPNHLGARDALPPAWWGESSGLACLDRAVADVWREGYGHHIARLMVLSNIATLLDVSPRELADWFWVAYTDAFDWVVEPNVLGMGTFAVGDLMTTKPYVSGAAYIARMGDACGECAFDPRRDCPITALYWAFLDRHREALAGNPRLAMPLRSLERRGGPRRAADRALADRARATLAAGRPLTPLPPSPASPPSPPPRPRRPRRR